MQVQENTTGPSHAGRRATVRAASMLLMAGIAFASQQLYAANALLDVSHVALPGNKQQLALTLSGPAEIPKSFTIDNPARIALDLPDTTNDLDTKRVAISAGLLRNVTTVEAGGRTRVVVNLTAMAPYTTAVSGNKLLVTFDNSGTSVDPTSLAAANPVSSSLASENAAAVARGKADIDTSSGPIAARDNTINGMDFRRGPMGEGRVIFDLSSAGILTDLRQEGGRLVVEFPDTKLAAKLQRRLDVMDFGTPVQFIDTISNKRGTKVIIQPSTQDYEQLAYQSDNLFTVELKPMSRDELENNRKAKFGYVGEKLSLNFQDIEIRSVLQLLADFTDLNIVVSDAVDGKLTLRLKNVPWDQALEIILQAKALGKRQAGNVIMIAPAGEIAERERLELEGLAQKIELAPLRTEYFQANYAKAGELARLLESESGGILSERG